MEVERMEPFRGESVEETWQQVLKWKKNGGGGGCVRRVSTVRQESTTRFRIQKEGERRNPALSRKGALAEWTEDAGRSSQVKLVRSWGSVSGSGWRKRCWFLVWASCCFPLVFSVCIWFCFEVGGSIWLELWRWKFFFSDWQVWRTWFP